MFNLKNKFDIFIDTHGEDVFIGYTSKMLHCDCWNPISDEGQSDCVECLGTGWYYNWYKTKCRKSATYFNGGKLDSSESVKVSSIGYEFFLKTEIPIGISSFILLKDYKTGHLITNYDFKKGVNNNPVYKVALGNKVAVNVDLFRKKANILMQEKLEEK